MNSINLNTDYKNIELPRKKNFIRWRELSILTGKILLVALVIAALAAATYFSAGMALPLIYGAAGSGLFGALAAFGAFGCGCATLVTPWIGATCKMYRVTTDNFGDCKKFLRTSLLWGVLAAFTLLYHTFHTH